MSGIDGKAITAIELVLLVKPTASRKSPMFNSSPETVYPAGHSTENMVLSTISGRVHEARRIVMAAKIRSLIFMGI